MGGPQLNIPKSVAELSGWNPKGQGIAKTYLFADFRSALDFVNRVGQVAEEQGHHPDLHLAWGRVDVETWTHDANGLTEKDFKLAAEIDRLFSSR
jgi:4a-hydroxytetrahydrobiopterin dehydratase